jgi:hypothetical protein
VVLAGLAILGPLVSPTPLVGSQTQGNRVTATLSPQTHDFGKATIGSQVVATFHVRLNLPTNPNLRIDYRTERVGVGFATAPSNVTNSDFLVPEDILPNPFGHKGPFVETVVFFPLDECIGFGPVPQTVDCSFDVYFAPKHIGPRSGELVVSYLDQQWSASVKGEGIPGCVMKVVPCNYGQLYSGSFTWNRTLVSPGNSYKENVEVGVKDGVATCHGSVTDTDNGNIITGVVDGPALFAVEFEPDPTYKLVYRVTAACPTPAFPAIPADGVEATKSQPAELGHNDQNSEKQPAKELVQSALVGTVQYPAPETDPVNSVTGTVIISWTLRRK